MYVPDITCPQCGYTTHIGNIEGCIDVSMPVQIKCPKCEETFEMYITFLILDKTCKKEENENAYIK